MIATNEEEIPMESGAEQHAEGGEQATPEEIEQAAGIKHTPDDEAHTVVGDEGRDVPAQRPDSQEPLGAEDGHGTVTQRSAPDPQHQSGQVAPEQGQPGEQQTGAQEGEDGGESQGE